MSIEKSTKKEDYNCPHFLRLMLFDKFFCRFSSLLDIYKSTFLRYNITRRWAIARRVPSFAHRGSVSVKCQSHDIPLSRNGQRCAFLIFRDPSFLVTDGSFLFAIPHLPLKKGQKNEILPPLTPSKKVIFTTLHHPIDKPKKYDIMIILSVNRYTQTDDPICFTYSVFLGGRS